MKFVFTTTQVDKACITDIRVDNLRAGLLVMSESAWRELRSRIELGQQEIGNGHEIELQFKEDIVCLIEYDRLLLTFQVKCNCGFKSRHLNKELAESEADTHIRTHAV